MKRSMDKLFKLDSEVARQVVARRSRVRQCPECGATFTSSGPRARYCGRTCKQAANRRQRHEKQLGVRDE